MASDLKTRAVLAPTMLLLIGGVYWLDYQRTLGFEQGTLHLTHRLLHGFLRQAAGSSPQTGEEAGEARTKRLEHGNRVV